MSWFCPPCNHIVGKVAPWEADVNHQIYLCSTFKNIPARQSEQGLIQDDKESLMTYYFCSYTLHWYLNQHALEAPLTD